MIAEILLYDMYSMRSSAMEVLMKLEATALTPHLDAIIGLFTNLRTGVADERIRDMVKYPAPTNAQGRADARALESEDICTQARGRAGTRAR